MMLWRHGSLKLQGNTDVLLVSGGCNSDKDGSFKVSVAQADKCVAVLQRRCSMGVEMSGWKGRAYSRSMLRPRLSKEAPEAPEASHLRCSSKGVSSR